MRLRILLVAALLALIAFAVSALAVPHRVIVAPGVTLTVVDSGGHPLSGICVWEAWEHYSVEEHEHTFETRSDSLGRVYLPARDVELSRLDVWTGNLKHFAQNPVHSSYGPHSYAVLRGPNLEGEAGFFGRALDAPPHRVVMRFEAQPEAMSRRLPIRCDP
jgi:hypothetical protein